MPVPLIIWAGVGVAGLVAGGYAADKVTGATEEAAKLTKWAVAGGTVYVAYRALQATGSLK